MFLEARQDYFGHIEDVTSDKLRKILDLVDGYMKVPYKILEIWQDDINEPNGRIDVVVGFNNEKNFPVQQKLLILKDELIDGVTFHKRYHEWYK